jgi:adenylate cyclase
MSLREFLLAQGVPPEDVDDAEAHGEQSLELLAIDRLFLPANSRYTPDEIAKLAGIDRELAKKYWRALGFVDVPDDEPAFNDLDLAALQGALSLIEQGYTRPQANLQLTRVMGQALARVAEAQVTTLRERIEEQLRAKGVPDAELVETEIRDAARLVPINEVFLSYIYRRHMAAAAKRSLVSAERDGRTARLAVGFCDLVGFTAMARRVELDALGTIVERFETTAYDVIGALGGRLVKMIGDEVMFVAEDPSAAAEIALQLSAAHANDKTLPDVRVGIAFGNALPREGDFFGETVNLANRIAAVALPRTVLVSEDMAGMLREDPSYLLRRVPSRMLKGIGRVKLWALRRPA